MRVCCEHCFLTSTGTWLFGVDLECRGTSCQLMWPASTLQSRCTAGWPKKKTHVIPTVRQNWWHWVHEDLVQRGGSRGGGWGSSAAPRRRQQPRGHATWAGGRGRSHMHMQGRPNTGEVVVGQRRAYVKNTAAAAQSTVLLGDTHTPTAPSGAGILGESRRICMGGAALGSM